MLYSEDVVFIHTPKTGGMSVTRFLVNALDPPVIVFAPENAAKNTVAMATHDDARKKLSFRNGTRHETCREALSRIEHAGLPLPKKAFSIVRDPGALLRSYYLHLRKPHVWKRRGMTRETLRNAPLAAMTLPFREFLDSEGYYGKSESEILDYFEPCGIEIFDIVAIEHIGEYLKLAFGHHRNFPKASLEKRNTSDLQKQTVTISDDDLDAARNRYPEVHKLYLRALDRPWMRLPSNRYKTPEP